MREASEEILFARRRLDEIENLEIVGDLKRDENESSWYLLVSIHVNEPNEKTIPDDSMWYIVFSANYPKGNVNVYPAVEGGIKNTFNHQNNNGIISKCGLWRSGKLCLNNPLEHVANIDNEPVTFEDRLYWNALRAVQWVNAVANGNLIRKNDYYEVPDFNRKKIHAVIYDEDEVSIMEWEDSEETYGFVDLSCGGNNQYYANTFLSLAEKICKSTKWGDYVNEKKEKIYGAWIIMDKEPVVNGWQAPNIFQELKIALSTQNIDIKNILEKIMPCFRDGKRHILMIGFPIPKKIGEERTLIHWESLLLPVLTYGKKTAKGFRCNEQGQSRKDFQEIITNKMELEWLITENWNSKEILSRGRFKRSLLRKKILLVGAGTLGAYIGEHLVRGGAYRLSIMDDDIYTIGNSARHILTIKSVGKHKASELAEHYNSISPTIAIKAITKELTEETASVMEEYDVILDCTANNEVLKVLESHQMQSEKKYFSVSFGYMAEVLYFAYQTGKSFKLDQYIDKFSGMLKQDEKRVISSNLPWEGTGCWSPVFPAMASDVQLVASFATGIIKSVLENEVQEDRHYMYKKEFDEDGVIKGFVRI